MLGKVICELPPSEQNRRNSEGDFITLNNGDILFAYTRYENSWEDSATANIYALRSTDNGESFSEPFLILSHEEVGAANVMAASFKRMKNGDLGLFALAKDKEDHCHPFIVRSSDEGKTWSKPIFCNDRPGYYCVVNGRVVDGENGRLIVPASSHGQALSHLIIFASDDDGFTWQTIAEGPTVKATRGYEGGISEPGVVRLQNKLWCFMRNLSGWQYECFSYDNGHTWTEPSPSWFSSPDSPMTAKRLKDGRIIAFWNPVPVFNGRQRRVDGVLTHARNPLVFAVSNDDGETFKGIKTLENDEKSGFCYLAMMETADNALLLGYSAGGPGDSCTLNRMRIRKIDLSEI